MTPCAIVPEASLVVVFVACSARGCQPEPCVAQILASKQRAQWAGNVLRCVARAAPHSHVFAIECVARLRMIETFGGWTPVNHIEVHAVVVGMAFDAGGAGRP